MVFLPFRGLLFRFLSGVGFRYVDGGVIVGLWTTFDDGFKVRSKMT